MDDSVLTWVEISKGALRHNITQFQRVIGHTALYAVIKSNAYGHGMREVVSVLESNSAVQGFMTATVDEALALKPITQKQRIVLSIWPFAPEVISKALKQKIVLPVYSLSQAQWLSKLAGKIGRTALITLKIDVGTLRLGFRYDENIKTIVAVCKLPHVKVIGIGGHFADSESFDETVTKEQARRFAKVVDSLEHRGFDIPLKYIACSAATLRSRAYLHSAVRIGIALYGLWPSLDIQRLAPTISLKPVLTWKTRVIQVKRVKEGEAIGYGLSYRAPKDMRIAIIPIGYWDGYDRKLSNQGQVLIGGVRCPVRGRVCMNLTMVQIPDRMRVTPGDTVVLLGTQKKERISVEELARFAGTINYEIVTRINPLIFRRITA